MVAIRFKVVYNCQTNLEIVRYKQHEADFSNLDFKLIVQDYSLEWKRIVILLWDPNDTPDWQMITSHSSTVNLYVNNMDFIWFKEFAVGFYKGSLGLSNLSVDWVFMNYVTITKLNIKLEVGKYTLNCTHLVGRDDQSWRSSHQTV